MIDATLIRLGSEFGPSADRQAAARAIARHLGGEAFLILVEDLQLHRFLPAPGLAQTLPGGPSWRHLTTQLHTPGVHVGEVTWPGRDRVILAHAVSRAGCGAVLLGERYTASQIETLHLILPLWAAMLRAEQECHAAGGELQVARQQARESATLAKALDLTRTDLEQTLRDLETQRRAAEEAGRSKDEFLAMLGHELRNPLSPILTALQLLRLRGHASREFDVIDRQVASLTRLVDDLLDISRITRGKIELRKRPVELADVIGRAVEMASPEFERKGQVLSLAVPARDLRVNADPGRLAQVFANILMNAAKYSDPQTRVTVKAEMASAGVRVRITDEGIGITAAMLPRIFDAFIQQPQSLERSQGGIGLGLAIVRSLVELHGGRVWASSAGEGLGSEFVVELPVTSAEVPAVTETEPRTPSMRAATRERVLIVDDNADAASTLAQVLAVVGYDVQVATDAPGALALARDFRPAVAVLDIGLPVMDGYELARRLRGLEFGGPMRLIAVTGYGLASDRRRALDSGFDAHLVKPVDVNLLIEALNSPLHPQRRGA